MPVSTRGRPAKFRQPRQGQPIYTPDAPNRYIRCQYCGFPCDTKRDRLSNKSGLVVSFPPNTVVPSSYIDLIPDVYTTPYMPLITYAQHQAPDIEVAFNCPACGAQYTKTKGGK